MSRAHSPCVCADKLPGIRDGPSLRITRFEREWDAGLRSLHRERTRRRVSRSAKPFASLDALALAEGGYVQGRPGYRRFYAPDADVLLSDVFLAQHCFSVERAAPEPHWLGLAFEPTRRRRESDIRGVIWLDTLDARLRRLDYAYANLPDDLPGDASGGRVAFEHLADGSWIVSAWWVRMPRVGVRRGPSIAGDDLYEAIGYVDVGGVVEGLATGRASPSGAVGAGWVRGSATDGLTGSPLAGARVVVTGTALSAVTDVDGSFLLEDVPAGERGVTHFHPSVSALGVPSPVVTVHVQRGDTARVALASPGFDAIALRLCPDEGSPVETLLAGRLVDAEGRPRAGVPVRAAWKRSPPGAPVVREAWAEATTGSEGRYAFCGVPADAPVEVRVKAGGSWSTLREAVVERRRPSFAESVVPATGEPPEPRGSRGLGLLRRRDAVSCP